MNDKTREALETLNNKTAGFFYDDSNMFYASRDAGWNVSIQKLRTLFEQRCEVEFFNYYVAIPRKSDKRYEQNRRYLNTIEPYVTLKEKNLRYITNKSGQSEKTKGDVDVDIAVDAMNIANNNSDIDVFVIFSGDSDFLPLKEFLIDKGKLVLFACFESNMARELQEGWHVYFDKLKSEVAYQNIGPEE